MLRYFLWVSQHNIWRAIRFKCDTRVYWVELSFLGYSDKVRSLSLSVFFICQPHCHIPLEFPMPPRYPLAWNVELQLYFRQLVCVLLGNFLYNLNSSSGFSSPIVPTQVVVHLPGPAPVPSMPLVGFVFANNLGHIVLYSTKTSADNGTLGPR